MNDKIIRIQNSNLLSLYSSSRLIWISILIRLNKLYAAINERCNVFFQCDMAKATKIFFDMMHENTTKVMLFGDACPNVTGPLAQISKWWNMSQVSRKIYVLARVECVDNFDYVWNYIIQNT